MRPVAIALVIAALGFASCGTLACKNGTAFVSYSLAGGAQSADTIDVTVKIGSGAAETKSVKRQTTSAAGSIELDFGSYPTKQTITITLAARQGSHVLATQTQSLAASAACLAAAFTLDAGNATPSDMAIPGDGVAGDSGADLSMGAVAASQQLWPLSTGTVTSLRPNFKWKLAPGATGAHIDFCSDRACTGIIGSFDAIGSSGAPANALPSNTLLYWRLFSTVSAAVASVSSPVWELRTGKLTTTANTSFGTIFDVNGDGSGDVAVGAPEMTGAAGTPGHALVYFGSTGTDWRTTAPPLRSTLSAGTASDAFGYSVSSAGDVNGDGYADLIVGAPQYWTPNPPATAGNGAAYVYLGGPSGLASPPTAASVLALSAGAAKDRFGASVAAAGDVDGDGYGDVVVGAPGVNNGTGAAYIFLGGPNGFGANPTPAYTLLGSTTANSLFGGTVASAGDVDGDGYSDVLVAAYNETSNTGAVYVFRGGPMGITASATPAFTTRLVGMAGDISFGISATGFGDVNGDGYCDIAIARRYSNDYGDVYVYLGGSSGINAMQTPYVLPNPSFVVLDMSGGGGGPYFGNDFFGEVVSAVGDVDGDGNSDLVVGAPGAPGIAAGAGPGRAYVYFAYEITGANPKPAMTLLRNTEANGDQFGFAVFPVGDMSNDGHADFAIGAPATSGNAGELDMFIFTSNFISPQRKPDYTLASTIAASQLGY
jgi:hypothetical protein